MIYWLIITTIIIIIIIIFILTDRRRRTRVNLVCPIRFYFFPPQFPFPIYRPHSNSLEFFRRQFIATICHSLLFRNIYNLLGIFFCSCDQIFIIFKFYWKKLARTVEEKSYLGERNCKKFPVENFSGKKFQWFFFKLLEKIIKISGSCFFCSFCKANRSRKFSPEMT